MPADLPPRSRRFASSWLSGAEAARHGLRDRDRIDVTKEGAHPHTLFCDVLVRVSPGCKSELHLDPDECDAAGLHTGAYVGIKRKPGKW
jgi:propanediol utilization protein